MTSAWWYPHWNTITRYGRGLTCSWPWKMTARESLFHRLGKWAPSSKFVSSSIPPRQVLTAHAQPFREARDLAFCLKVPLDSLLVWASSGGSGETVRMRRLAWTFAARIGDKYQIRLTRSKWQGYLEKMSNWSVHYFSFSWNSFGILFHTKV